MTSHEYSIAGGFCKISIDGHVYGSYIQYTNYYVTALFSLVPWMFFRFSLFDENSTGSLSPSLSFRLFRFFYKVFKILFSNNYAICVHLFALSSDLLLIKVLQDDVQSTYAPCVYTYSSVSYISWQEMCACSLHSRFETLNSIETRHI